MASAVLQQSAKPSFRALAIFAQRFGNGSIDILKSPRLIISGRCRSSIASGTQNSSLLPVGRWLTANPPNTNYRESQCFIHRVFGYRGMILFPWETVITEKVTNNGAAECSNPKPVTYYRAIIHEDDWRESSLIPSVISILTTSTDRPLRYLPGFDHVSHADVLPFDPINEEPIKHRVFPYFFDTSPTTSAAAAAGNNNTSTTNTSAGVTFRAKTELQRHRERQQVLLKMSQVYCETDNENGLRVTVIPFFCGHSVDKFKWEYTIRIENLSEQTMVVRSQHFRFYPPDGTKLMEHTYFPQLRDIALTKRRSVCQETQMIDIGNAKGHAWGHIELERETGEIFRANIPTFHFDYQDATTDLNVG